MNVRWWAWLALVALVMLCRCGHASPSDIESRTPVAANTSNTTTTPLDSATTPLDDNTPAYYDPITKQFTEPVFEGVLAQAFDRASSCDSDRSDVIRQLADKIHDVATRIGVEITRECPFSRSRDLLAPHARFTTKRSGGSFVCHECGKTFAGRVFVRQHLQRRHIDLIVRGSADGVSLDEQVCFASLCQALGCELWSSLHPVVYDGTRAVIDKHGRPRAARSKKWYKQTPVIGRSETGVMWSRFPTHFTDTTTAGDTTSDAERLEDGSKKARCDAHTMRLRRNACHMLMDSCVAEENSPAARQFHDYLTHTLCDRFTCREDLWNTALRYSGSYEEDLARFGGMSERAGVAAGSTAGISRRVQSWWGIFGLLDDSSSTGSKLYFGLVAFVILALLVFYVVLAFGLANDEDDFASYGNRRRPVGYDKDAVYNTSFVGSTAPLLYVNSHAGGGRLSSSRPGRYGIFRPDRKPQGVCLGVLWEVGGYVSYLLHVLLYEVLDRVPLVYNGRMWVHSRVLRFVVKPIRQCRRNRERTRRIYGHAE